PEDRGEEPRPHRRGQRRQGQAQAGEEGRRALSLRVPEQDASDDGARTGRLGRNAARWRRDALRAAFRRRYTVRMSLPRARIETIAANEYRRVRWRNGLGWTREIARMPHGDAFDWRLSIAEIERD